MSLKRCTGCAASRGKDFSLPDCMEVERSIVAKMNGVVKRLKRELQCEGAITKYYKDTVELPDGKTAVWDFVGHNGAAAAVAVLEDGRLLMVRNSGRRLKSK